MRSSNLDRTFTREQIKQRIALGDVIVIHRSSVYKLNSWLKKHPGGELAILHFVGRDATDEIEAYHPEHVIKQMRPFVIGCLKKGDQEVDGKIGLNWRPLNPPVQIGLWPIPNDKDLSYLDSGYDEIHEGEEDSSDDLNDDKSKIKIDIRRIIKLLEPNDPKKTISESCYNLDPTHQQQISKSYHELHEKVKRAGLYKPPSFLYGYGTDLIRYSFLFSIFFITSPWYRLVREKLFNSYDPSIILSGSTFQYFVSAVFLGLWWHQITFVVHDAGHCEVTGNWEVDRLVGISIANFLGGLSVGWWCDNHDIHHLVTNHPEHDPDIQHLPFFAISTKFFESLRSTYYKRVMEFSKFSKRLVKHQHRLYYFIMMFARFNLFSNSYIYLYNRKDQRFRNLEISGIIFFWCYFLTLIYLLPSWPIRIMFVIVSFAVTSPLHVQIVLSHFAKSTEDLGLDECFAHRQIRTTMDVDCPSYLDFIHGGLNMQIAHHLFPRLPRHNLRIVTNKFVKPWCKEIGLNYQSFKFMESNLKVLNVLQEVSNQIQILKLVASSQAKEKKTSNL
ncbi:fatty acid desaturase-domain-containing protein [Phakopsora pachyrhizi]|uniref:Delta 8-(E)-sphingolipid desaturase n=1 Tax=Phakopsora pachyrhizi TaxID=170000 RepID=A0AAV0AMX8_PHAPC|nr:fatty acid desaturase-domain-containing protein [Phakopsora pachyrhizi]CAH7670083.1 fatty acid desaturase-domain-containing protein [Phakopsora pachyrhizi]